MAIGGFNQSKYIHHTAGSTSTSAPGGQSCCPEMLKMYKIEVLMSRIHNCGVPIPDSGGNKYCHLELHHIIDHLMIRREKKI